jgi:phosphoribosylformimino-5-aminoimidazole carboxamide ribotide isomerase
MRVLPVLDLKAGVVVRGVAGRRHEYQPICSRLTPTAQPLDVARAFRQHFGLTELYLADLDAIGGAGPALGAYVALRADGFRLWVDAGLKESAGAQPLAAAGVEGLVAGLETLTGPAALSRLCQDFGGQRIIFSLDLKGGQPLAQPAWEVRDAFGVASQAAACGVSRLIVLDLERVGTSEGTGTDDLCARLATAFPTVEIVAGGGVRDVADLRRLRQLGTRGALVASALHDGRLTRGDLEDL